MAAGPRVGFGHLLRARALARALQVPLRVSVRGGAIARTTARALGCRLVGNAAGTASAPGSVLRNADLLVVDDPSAACGRVWVRAARRSSVRCVSVHDGTPAHDVDLAVDGSLGALERTSAVRLLSGARFYILDDRIARARRRPRRPHRQTRVLIALGGGEHVRRMAQCAVDAIKRRTPRVSISVASGFVRRDRPALRHARWISARRGLIGALRRCDVALVAGGVTLYETCALGVPAVGLAVVPEQRRAIQALARRRAILDAGGPPSNAAVAARAADGIARLIADDRLRRTLSSQGRRLVDGRGASRVARHIRTVLASGARRAA